MTTVCRQCEDEALPWVNVYLLCLHTVVAEMITFNYCKYLITCNLHMCNVILCADRYMYILLIDYLSVVVC